MIPPPAGQGRPRAPGDVTVLVAPGNFFGLNGILSPRKRDGSPGASPGR